MGYVTQASPRPFPRRDRPASSIVRAVTPLALLGALAIGLTLGLLGSGGSILTVPVLVYLVGVPEKAAIAESLAIVGLIAGGGVIPFIVRRLVSWSTVLLFSLPGMVGAYMGALAATRISARVQLILFAVLMLSAAGLMLRRSVAHADSAPHSPTGPTSPGPTSPVLATTASTFNPLHKQEFETVIVQGFGIGVLTGLVGVGGGFLIVPALVLLVHLPMHMAVGTSLATITLNSAAGFYKHAQVLPSLHLQLDWHIITLFAALGIVGSLTGSAIARYVPHDRLRRMFGVFLVIMAAFLLWKNTLGH
jgi:uncharacterized protein